MFDDFMYFLLCFTIFDDCLIAIIGLATAAAATAPAAAAAAATAPAAAATVPAAAAAAASSQQPAAQYRALFAASYSLLFITYYLYMYGGSGACNVIHEILIHVI